MIFIKGSVPSSKNGKRWTGNRLIHSKATMNYIKASKGQWIENKEKFQKMLEGKKKPYVIGYHFVRGTRHKYDWVNPVQTVQDLMVSYEWLEEDYVDIMFPKPFKIKGSYTGYDKDNPGVFIKVL